MGGAKQLYFLTFPGDCNVKSELNPGRVKKKNQDITWCKRHHLQDEKISKDQDKKEYKQKMTKSLKF